MSTIFSKIINGEISSYKVYEDDSVYAFLDINPMQEGHTLVVPKKEVDYIFDLESEDYLNLMDKSKYIANLLKEKLKCERVCVVVEGYLVPHAHIHLIPTNNADDFDKKFVHVASKEELENVYKKLIS